MLKNYKTNCVFRKYPQCHQHLPTHSHDDPSSETIHTENRLLSDSNCPFKSSKRASSFKVCGHHEEVVMIGMQTVSAKSTDCGKREDKDKQGIWVAKIAVKNFSLTLSKKNRQALF